MEQGEIILYQPNDSLRLEVRLDGDNRHQGKTDNL